MDANRSAIRARIGLIIPSVNTVVEPQFRQYAPPGVEPYVTRLRMTGQQHVPVLQLLPRIAEAAEALADARCDMIVFHCTGSSMEAGLEANQRIVETIERATGRPGTSTASAVLAAFHSLGVRRLVLVTPYAQQVNDYEIAFLREAGLEVLHDRAMDLPGGHAYSSALPTFWVQTTREAADPRAEAYFLSCANIYAIEPIRELEAQLQRPVVTSNQATLWYALRRCGLIDEVPAFGELGRRELSGQVPAFA